MDTDNKPAMNLAHRINALNAALHSFEANPAHATAVRRLVATLRASSEQNGMTELATLARAVEEAPREALADNLSTLITYMRLEFARQDAQQLTVLVVSADIPLRESLSAALEATSRLVITCDNADKARHILRDTPPSFLVVDTVLPDEDGRVLISDLRSNPVTTTMPIVAILPQYANATDSPALVHGADAHFNKPVDASLIANFMGSHFKRGYERGRESRRDQVSGLPNRAAFTEELASLLDTVKLKKEPLSLALIGLFQYDQLARECHDKALHSLIRSTGSILSSSFRATDILARWGIAEFAVALPGEDHFGMTCALEKVISQINRQTITSPIGKILPVHACAGSTMISPGESLKSAIHRAEGYLFQSLFNYSGEGIGIVSDAMPSPERTARIALCVADPKMENAITQMIARNQIDVVVIPDPKKALSQLVDSTFNMLIIDDALPGQTAFDLLGSIRASEPLQPLYVIILASNEASVSRALELGVDDYVLKPIVAESFLDRVRRPLANRNSFHKASRFTIMVVDQNIPQLLIAGTTLFQQTGSNIVLAHGFQDALSRFREHKPDCMILDFDIPDVALRDFVERLAKLPDFDKVQVVAASENALITDAIPRKLINLKGRIAHPYKPATFLEQLKSVITLPSPAPLILHRPPIDTEIQRVLSRPR